MTVFVGIVWGMVGFQAIQFELLLSNSILH